MLKKSLSGEKSELENRSGMAKMGEQVQLGGSSARIIFTTLVLIIETLSVGTQERNTKFKWDKNLQHQRFEIGTMCSNLLGKF